MKRIHVVAAALIDGKGNVLIAQRPVDKHQGGLWEFPGGKLEKDEDRWSGLRRELQEEIGVVITGGVPLIGISHDYSDKSVFLDVWLVDQWQGEARGAEGQNIRWISLHELDQFQFPAANRPIIKAIRLPELVWITPEPTSEYSFLSMFEHTIATHKLKLCQLRAKSIDDDAYAQLARDALNITRKTNTKLLLNADITILRDIDADGIHLSSERLMACHRRPLAREKLVGASVHNETQLRHACQIDVDFVVIGPVQPTASHPNTPHLGWTEFQRLALLSDVPVYALGGMQQSDLLKARNVGGQGIAGISTFLTRSN